MLAEHRLDKRDFKRSGRDNRINRIATVVILLSCQKKLIP